MIQALIFGVIIAGTLTANGPSEARLMRQPDISRHGVAFIYAGDW